MLNFILTVLGSFLFTFVISIPFIHLLYRFNIRRLSESNLEKLLPGRSKIKLGTPIMGGAVIVAAILVLGTILLNSWKYYPMVVLITVLGGVVGIYDEYTNALGKTFGAMRQSMMKEAGKPISLIKVEGVLLKVKKAFLVPWRLFEESVRIVSSKQRGVKPVYKLLMHFSLSLVVVLFLALNGHSTSLYVPIVGDIQLGWLFWIFVVFLVIGYINAFGITDGVDGLSAGTHSLSFGIYGILAAYMGLDELAYLCFIIVGAELAFLYFNIKPARMQMSDVGTVPLGMLFVIIAVLMHREVTLPIVGVVFTVEILSSVGQQWSVKLRGKRILLVAPIHHHFEKLGWSENKIVERFWLVTVVAGLIGIVVGLT